MLTAAFELVLSDQGGACSHPAAAIIRMLSASRQDDRPIEIRSDDLDDIRSSRQGDSEAYRRLIQRHQAAVGKLLWRFTRDRTEHEELVQQVFVQAYTSLDNYAAKAPFAHWLARIATRVGYRYWQQKRKDAAVTLSDEAWAHLETSQDEPTDAAQAAELVYWLLARLPAKDRLVLTLRYLEQNDIAQIAYKLGWTQTRVRVQTHRAIEKLKKILADNHIELDL